MKLTDLMIKMAADAAMPQPAGDPAAGAMDPATGQPMDPSMMAPPDPIADDNARLQSLLENLQLRSQIMEAQQELAASQAGGTAKPTSGNKPVDLNSERADESNPVAQAGIAKFNEILGDSGIVREPEGDNQKNAPTPPGAAVATKQNQEPGAPVVTTGNTAPGNR